MAPETAAVEGRALGCTVRVVVTRTRGVRLAEIAVAGVLRAIDQSCSRFRPDSELSHLNASPEREVRLGSVLWTALETAVRAARLSRGAVDPTVGRAVAAAGYDRDFVAVLRDGSPPRPSPLPGWRRIRMDARQRTVCIPRGVAVDLGATAKALAADLAAEAAQRAAGGGVLVSLGGDVAVRGKPAAGGWRVQVSEDSARPVSARDETISISDGGVATSSTTVRRWRRGGAVMHHVIDPRTGLPAAGPWRTVTVAAATCVDANTASTAAIVLGDDAVPWLTRTGLPARLVHRSGSIVRLGGWPRPSGEAAA